MVRPPAAAGLRDRRLRARLATEFRSTDMDACQHRDLSCRSLLRPASSPDPFYRTWMALTMPLGRLISTGILAAIYFGAITPLALFQKLLRRDHLKRRFDASAQTYWEPYNPSEDTDRYFRQS